MAVVKNMLNWSGGRDKEGHRHYEITWLVYSTVLEGPEKVGGATGLAAIGSTWNFGSDLDAWALCQPTLKIKPVLKKEPGRWWEVQQTFSTKPRHRCQDTEIENPINEPPDISGGFVKYTREVTKDRNGDPVESSSHEMFRGQAVTFDDNRPTVSITLNVLSFPLGTFASMVDTLNDATLWGLGPRKIKLSNVSWERLLYGTCTFYYRLTYEFDIRDTDEGFDRVLIDEGTKVLKPGGNANDPRDFQVYKDGNGENTRVLLDGAGSALANGNSPHEITLEYYDESNFLALGIPTSL